MPTAYSTVWARGRAARLVGSVTSATTGFRPSARSWSAFRRVTAATRRPAATHRAATRRPRYPQPNTRASAAGGAGGGGVTYLFRLVRPGRVVIPVPARCQQGIPTDGRVHPGRRVPGPGRPAPPADPAGPARLVRR